MLVAAFGGVRGNLPALNAVLEAIDAEGIQTLVNTGDSVVGHPWPNETIGLLRQRGIPSVQGEWDRRLLRFRRKETSSRDRYSDEERAKLEFAFDACESKNLEYLRGLPRSLTFTVDGIQIALCHGTYTSQSQSLSASDGEDAFRRQREIMPAPVFICGNSREGFARQIQGTLFVNPGYCGEDTGASYAVISTESEPWRTEIRRVG